MYVIDYIYDLIKANLEELKELKEISSLKLQNKENLNPQELISFFSFINYKIEKIRLRNKEFTLLIKEKNYEEKVKYLNNLLKVKNNLKLIDFIEKEKELFIGGYKILNWLKNRKYSNLIKLLKKINNDLEKRIDDYLKLKEKIEFIFSFLHNLKFEKIVLHKRILAKLKNKEVFLKLSEVVFNNLKEYKTINNFFIQVEIGNFVFIIRRDSLYIPLIIIEEILYKKNIKDVELLEYYWNNLIIPYEKENEELERIYLNNSNKNENIGISKFYVVFDREFFILKYFNIEKIKEIL